ncbi:MAG: tripartite tricarboxylate transporter permease [Treponema sp.]|nr:tripartite tricarboxylate transporter permease [Treponema sp.]
MSSDILAGMAAVFEPTAMLLVLFGALLGIIFGTIPGLSATMAVAICLPISFAFQPVQGISLLLGLYVGGVSGGSVTSILLGIPGTASSIATVWDGKPMTDKGLAGKALSIDIFITFLANIVGFLFLIFLAPQIARLALRFAPFEYFAVTIFSITLISSLTGKSVVKGLLAGLMGMALAMVGDAPIDSYPRYTFGTDALMIGFSILPVLIGLYAISEVFSSAEKRDGITSDKLKTDFKIRGLAFGFTKKEFFQQIPNFIRSSLIGVGIGILPGIGGGTSNIISYAVAKRQSKYPEKFGTGIIDGLVAPETTNSTAIGGSMVPLLTLGIPGDTVTAIILGGFMMHQIVPGPMLFRTSGDLVFALFTALMVSATIVYIVQSFGIRLIVKIVSVPKNVLLSIVVVFCAVGAFATNNRIFDVQAMLILGIIGFLLLKFKFPLPPIILGFILAPIAELNLRRGLMMSQGSFLPFVTSPIAAAFLAVALASVVFSVIREIKAAKQ